MSKEACLMQENLIKIYLINCKLINCFSELLLLEFIRNVKMYLVRGEVRVALVYLEVGHLLLSSVVDQVNIRSPCQI